MIRSLRRKFIIIAMVSLIGTMAVLCTAIGIGNYYVTANRVDKAISILYQNGGTFLSPGSHFDPSDFNFQITPETAFETRYFIVQLTEQKEIKSVNLEHIAALDRQTVVDTISRIIDAGTERGYVDHYRFGIFSNKEGGSAVVVVNCFLQLQSVNNMLRITVSIFLACVLIVFILLLFLSKRAIRPFVDNLERQRQFVTDASHELKTPLAILSADMGLMEDTYGKDKWLESAQSQIVRLDKLIGNLVELARTEETVKEDAVVCFSVSEIAQANADAFQPLAEADGKALTAEITSGISTRGVQDNFFRLFSILLDNAVKYCDPGGTIHLSVSLRGRHICVSVSNPCAGVDTAQLSRYFDRFYRADSSRARSTGGYGIGLSTAKAIVTRHKGRISNHYADGTITFTAVIPQTG
ncbi:MAG: GHKL domain-containing protein [Oscillospiraceae bacterium]|nr:GHKL domain-containing protein [Oscillospiraceae bacterium]